jgi:hypothetical protein
MERARMEEILETYPDKIADALFEWRKETATLEKMEGELYRQAKLTAEANGLKMTTDEIKALVRSNDVRFKTCLEEARAEAEHTRYLETLLAAKKLADFRTAF